MLITGAGVATGVATGDASGGSVAASAVGFAVGATGASGASGATGVGTVSGLVLCQQADGGADGQVTLGRNGLVLQAQVVFRATQWSAVELGSFGRFFKKYAT